MQEHGAGNGHQRGATPGQQDVIALAVDAAFDRKIEQLMDPNGNDPLIERLFAPGSRLSNLIESAADSIATQASEKALETIEARAVEVQHELLARRGPPNGGGDGRGSDGNGRGDGGGDEGGPPRQRREPGEADAAPPKPRRSAIINRVIDDVSSDPKTFLGELLSTFDRGLEVFDRHADSRANREARLTNPFLLLEGLNQTPMGQAAIGYFAPDQLGGRTEKLLADAYARGMGARIEGAKTAWAIQRDTTPTPSSETPSATSNDPNGAGSAVPTETPESPTARMGADAATSAGSRPMIELAAPGR